MDNAVRIINHVSGPLSSQLVRDKIEALEDEWKKLDQIDIPVTHQYSGGIYAREIVIPKGTLLTGRIYKDDHFDVMVSGDVTVSSDEGIKRLTGFHCFPGARGKKRAGYAHEDTRWITFCSSEEMAEDDYLDHLTVEKFAQLEGAHYIEETEILQAFRSQKSYHFKDYPIFRVGYLMGKNKPSKLDADRADYFRVLEDFGFTEEIVRVQSENEDDQVSVEAEGVEVANSIIEGRGLFTTKRFSAGDVIMAARIKGMRTIAGRFSNHAISPNARMVMNGDDVNLVAIMDIDRAEITTNYRDTLNLQIKRAV